MMFMSSNTKNNLHYELTPVQTAFLNNEFIVSKTIRFIIIICELYRFMCNQIIPVYYCDNTFHVFYIMYSYIRSRYLLVLLITNKY